MTDTPNKPDFSIETLYEGLHAARGAELSAYWTRYQIFATVNFVFLGLSLDSFKTNQIMLLVLFAFGLFLCLLWIWIIYLSKRHIEKRWDHCIYKFEKKYCERLGMEERESFDYFPIIRARDFEHKGPGGARNWINMNIVALLLPFTCGGIWVCITVEKYFKLAQYEKLSPYIFGAALMMLVVMFCLALKSSVKLLGESQ